MPQCMLTVTIASHLATLAPHLGKHGRELSMLISEQAQQRASALLAVPSNSRWVLLLTVASPHLLLEWVPFGIHVWS